MRLSHYQSIFALNIAQLIVIIFKHKFTCTLGEAWRPPEMAKIYKQLGKGIKGSQHCKKLALDINLFKDGKYLRTTEAHAYFGGLWETLHPNNRWGGRYGDGNHYEMLTRKV